MSYIQVERVAGYDYQYLGKGIKELTGSYQRAEASIEDLNPIGRELFPKTLIEIVHPNDINGKNIGLYMVGFTYGFLFRTKVALLFPWMANKEEENPDVEVFTTNTRISEKRMRGLILRVSSKIDRDDEIRRGIRETCRQLGIYL